MGKIEREIDILVRKLEGDYIKINIENYKVITIRLDEKKSESDYFKIWIIIPLIFGIFFLYKGQYIISTLLLLFFIILKFVDYTSKKAIKESLLKIDLVSKQIVYNYSGYEGNIDFKDITKFSTQLDKVSIEMNSISTSHYFELMCKTKYDEILTIFRVIDIYEADLVKKERAILKFLNSFL